MDLTVDFIVGFLIFTITLSICLSWIISTSIPAPLGMVSPRAYEYPVHLVVYRDGDNLVIDSSEGLVVYVTVVCFTEDSYSIVRGRTPLRLSLYSFIVAFSGSCVRTYGTPPNLRAYITPYGVYTTPNMELTTPYVYIKNGKIHEIKPLETGKFILGFKRVVVINGTVMIGGY